MTTILPKEREVTDRESVILSNAERRNIRRKLRETVEVAQYVLNPRTQLTRFVGRSTTAAKRVADQAAEIARKNAPVIGAVGFGALLLIGRRPISKWISRIKRPTEPNEE